jgi:cytochrome c556
MKTKDQFMDMAQQFEGAAEKLSEAAKNDDLKAIKAQFAPMAMTCKMCHGTYRK